MKVSGMAVRWLAGGLVTVCMAAALAQQDAPAKASGEERIDELFGFVPETAAKIDGKAISATDVKRALHPQFTAMINGGYEPTAEELHRVAANTIERLINDWMLLSACDAAGFKADPAAAVKRVEDLEAKVGAERFEEGLARQGMSREELAGKIAEQAMINEWLFKSLMPEIKVSDDELAKAYEENRDALKVPEQVTASHILFRVAADADDATRQAAHKKATEALVGIKKGADFAEMAEAHSDCPSSKMGGKLGTFGRGRMVPPFEAAAFALKPGEISGVVETEFGYHIILCEERTEAVERSFEESKQRLSEVLVQQKLDEKVQALIGDARQAAKIEILVPEL